VDWRYPDGAIFALITLSMELEGLGTAEGACFSTTGGDTASDSRTT